ncbi:hypothetical protein M430DRAFT_46920 [Amorphotheca resinae ATCC 22711]|uniref:Uncharacterized protein n=1 Tax=Amorphotheca resinae ATCC 22711 TaxID=857342 RepID=A0A2T3BEP5_AMORE|nr:hypothetical protein M430DRAFT_46920 [Amorphotheca resinae ATCC 22711]PSS27854.1 hypothetical protein M430DRAFT_46920 [Amorphotheca resinae ATCC 22711]
MLACADQMILSVLRTWIMSLVGVIWSSYRHTSNGEAAYIKDNLVPHKQVTRPSPAQKYGVPAMIPALTI